MRKLIGFFALVVVSVLTIACRDQNLSNIYTPKQWVDIFSQAGGWVPLPFPDSKYEPGSIIQVNEDGIRWIDHLKSCHYPKDLLDPKQSYIPNINFSASRELDASAMLNFKGISAGPEFQNISKVMLQVQDHGADALQLLKLKVWMEEPGNRNSVSNACMDELQKPNRYLVTESFRVSKASYKLIGKNGAAIKLDAPLLAKLLSIKPDVKYSTSSDGALTVDEPVYFAVRRAVRIGSDFEVLGADPTEPETADAKIAQIFMQNN